MAEKAAESGNEDLFGGVAMEGLENYLLTVDVPASEQVAEIVKEVNEGGDGEPPPSTEDPPKTKPEVQVEKTQTDNLITVDTAATEKTEITKVIETTEPGKVDETKKGTETKTGEENLSPMYLHAAALQQDYGLLPNFDLATIKDLKPEEQILKVNEAIQANVKAEKEELVKAEVDSLITPAKKFYEDLKAGVPFDDLANNASLEEQYGSITVKSLEANEEAQEAIYSDSLIMKGLSDVKVKQMIQLSKDNDSLLIDSTDGLKEIHTEIKNDRDTMRKAAETATQDRDKQNALIQTKIKTLVTGTKVIIPGLELTKVEHDQLIKDMTVPVKFVDNAQGKSVPVSKVIELRSQDPITFDMKLNYFIQKGFFDKDAKFDKLVKDATTSATKKLIDKMSTTKPVEGTPAVINQKETVSDDFIYPFPT